MSAYLCSDLTTITVAAGLVAHGLASYMIGAAAQLRDANNRALRARYNDAPVPLGSLRDVMRSIPRSALEIHREAKCLQYQCAEGDVIETHPIMPAVAELIDRLAGRALVEEEAERRAEQEAKEVKDQADFEAREAARVITSAPVFFWNGIKDRRGAKLQRCFYSDGALHHHPAGTITIYARDYERFSDLVRACFEVENRTDTMSDYFDNDSIRVLPTHPLYSQVRAALDAQQKRRA